LLARRALLLLPFFVASGCATLDDLWSSVGRNAAIESVPLEDRPVQEPIDPNSFFLESADQTVVGEPQVVLAREEDTLSDLARTYGLGYDEIIANIATKRLFYFPTPADGERQQVMTYPIGIGRVGWETPLGETTVVSKAKDPVPPGPDNPLGHRVLKLDMPGYLIHGTNTPYGVGMRISHGCVRLYPENIEILYTLVGVGENVMIINEPFQFGHLDGALYFEAHEPLEDDSVPAEERLELLANVQVDAIGQPLNEHLRDHVRALATDPRGIPVVVVQYDATEYMARARVVHNTVEVDADAPTLTEVREMIEEAEAEIAAEKEAL
jgi:L,D-transpeptidase ErfK/SrfK